MLGICRKFITNFLTAFVDYEPTRIGQSTCWYPAWLRNNLQLLSPQQRFIKQNVYSAVKIKEFTLEKPTDPFAFWK